MRWVKALEPLWWTLFGIGGTVAALLLPVHVFINNIAAPLGWISPDAIAYQTMARLVASPLVKAYLIIFLVTTLYHAAHRLGLLPEELLAPISKHTVGGTMYVAATALAIATVVIVVIAP